MRWWWLALCLGCGWTDGRCSRDNEEPVPRNRAMRLARAVEQHDFPAHIVVSPDEPWTPAMGDGEGLGSVQEALADQLVALGYAEGVEEAGDRPTGVLVHHRTRSAGGYNFVTLAGKPGAVLLDMDGQEVWRWTIRPVDIWPELDAEKDSVRNLAWRRAVLLPDGDVVGIWSGYGIARIDKDSRLKWAHFLPVHHDLQVHSDGSVVTLTRKPQRVDWVRPGEDILVDYALRLAPDGAVLNELDLLQAWKRNRDFASIWNSKERSSPDVFHTNSIQVLDDRLEEGGEAFASGNLLLSMRHLNSIAIVHPGMKKVVWHLEAGFAAQHDPRVVGPNRILLFDNKGAGDKSRLLEYDVVLQKAVWRFIGNKQVPFFTQDCGHAQRLWNGNTLVNESAAGRAFELREDGRLVWEWRTPETTKAGKISRIFEFRRVPAEQLSWLEL